MPEGVESGAMRLWVGTSGYSYKEWKGTFYPERLPAKEMLRYYAQRFQTVEINNTFYRLPSAPMLARWAEEVPERFVFVLKASRRITHDYKLKNVDESVAYFLTTVSVLGERLGPVLFQLPPALKKDVPRLREFLARLPPERRSAFEFRHASWFDNEVYDVLRSYGAALCIADADDELTVPFVSTADWGYLRLRRENYGDPELRDWRARIRGEGWQDAFVFFKHEEEGKGPQLAAQFAALED
jgi:uncharacterized protein YecE (DUF72 family)